MALAVIATGAGVAQAAITINLILPGFVQISGLKDVAFVSVDPLVAAINRQNNCVWSNTLSRGYTVTAGGGTGGSGAFTLTESGGKTATYTVAWAGTTNASTGTALSAGSPSAVFTSSASSPACDVGVSATSTLIVTVPATSLQTMVAGRNYTGTLTLVISPA